MKDSIKRVKQQALEWEKISAYPIMGSYPDYIFFNYRSVRKKIPILKNRQEIGTDMTLQQNRISKSLINI